VTIGQVAAGIGHEINNPLSVAIGRLDMLTMELRRSGTQSEYLDNFIKKEGQSLKKISNIVGELRSFSSSEFAESEVVNTHEIIRSSLNLVKIMYFRDGVKIDSDLNASRNNILGQSGKFEQVIINLLTNAKDATENCKDRHVKIKTVNEGETLKISVTDNGVGMSKAVQLKIFDSFFTTKSFGKGTGLGLGIVEKIINDMDGAILVQSEEGKGTTFEITLPIAIKTLPSGEEKLEAFEKKISGQALFVDDEEEIRTIMRSYLEEIGFTVDVADNGVTALGMVELKSYDMIITDLNMPRMGGIEFIKKAKKLPFGNTKYLAITAGSISGYSDKDRSQLKSLTVGCLLKPFTIQSLYEELKTYFKKDDKVA